MELMQAVYPVLQEMEGVQVMSCEVTDNHLYLQVVSDTHGKLVHADEVQNKLEEICRARKITYGSEHGGLAKDLAELCDGLPDRAE